MANYKVTTQARVPDGWDAVHVAHCQYYYGLKGSLTVNKI